MSQNALVLSHSALVARTKLFPLRITKTLGAEFIVILYSSFFAVTTQRATVLRASAVKTAEATNGKAATTKSEAVSIKTQP